MPVLDNPRHEKFAQLRASGKTGSDSYRGVAGANAKNPDVMADKWQRAPEIAARIKELQAEASARCSLTREQLVESLAQMYQGKPGEATLDNPLCDSLITRGQRFAVFPPKATIAAQLAKLCGWDAPTKLEVEAGENLSSFLGRLFATGGARGTLGCSFCENGERSKETSSSTSGVRR
jgi:hypothetical protein